jgi:hypothetical protein
MKITKRISASSVTDQMSVEAYTMSSVVWDSVPNLELPQRIESRLQPELKSSYPTISTDVALGRLSSSTFCRRASLS